MKTLDEMLSALSYGGWLITLQGCEDGMYTMELSMPGGCMVDWLNDADANYGVSIYIDHTEGATACVARGYDLVFKVTP